MKPPAAKRATSAGAHDAGADHAVLQAGMARHRSRAAPELAPPPRPARARIAAAPSGARSIGDAAGHHAVHHQPVPEGGGAGAQHAFAQHAAAGMRKAKAASLQTKPQSFRWLAMPLQLAHHRPQRHGRGGGALDAAARPRRPGRRPANARRCCRRTAGRRSGRRRAATCRSISAERALVRVAEPLLQPHHRLALHVEAEMAGLDDAGMHRADRDLVHALALDGEEFRLRRRAGRRRRRLRRERRRHRPAAMVEPGAEIDRALRHDGPRGRGSCARTAPRRGGPATARGSGRPARRRSQQHPASASSGRRHAPCAGSAQSDEQREGRLGRPAPRPAPRPAAAVSRKRSKGRQPCGAPRRMRSSEALIPGSSPPRASRR